MAFGPIISWQIDGEKWKQWQILFSEAPKFTADGGCRQKLKDASSLKTSYDKRRQHMKK